MWPRKLAAPGQILLLLLALTLGFWAGYRVLPQTGLAQALLTSRQLLTSSLPFSQPLAAQTAFSAPGLSPLPGALLLQAGLPQAASLSLPAEQEALPPKGEPRLIVMEEASIEAFAGLNKPPATATAEPRVLVYCTHSSEEYRDGARIPGARGGVHTVARALSDKLNQLGIATIYCDTVHDYPDWNLSYANSLASVQALAGQYPSLEVFIDVHRDSQANSILPTATGQLAKIMLVVGSDARLPHPQWKQNQAFSEQIARALEAHTQGITRGVSVQQGRYNQQISSRAILVEMGSTVNSEAEACASALLLAAALAEVL